MAVDVGSHLPEVKQTGYRLRRVNIGLWFSRPTLPLQFSSNEMLVGKPSTRRVFWNRLICSSGLLVDIVTASRALRHSNVSVKAGLYVDNRKRVAPDIGAMLAAKSKEGSHEKKPV